MGHRALVCYERDDGLYNVHYTHWGGHDLELVHHITPETPLGGEENEPAFMTGFLKALEDNLDNESKVTGHATEANPETAVEPDPIDVGVDLRTIVSELVNYVHHESVYLVDREFEVTGFRTLWYGLSYQLGDKYITVDRDEDDEWGILTTVRWYNDEPTYGRMHGQWDGWREVLAEIVDNDHMEVEEARDALSRYFIDHYGHREYDYKYIMLENGTITKNSYPLPLMG